MKKLLYIIPLVVLVAACSKESIGPNPYDSLPKTDTTSQQAKPDSSSITGLHQYIFSVKCANPGCHDGTFEPDFRTVQSSWTTMVYAKANKTLFDSLVFTKRVIPNDTTKSLLYHRLISSSSDYMPSNGQRLSRAEIDKVVQWIMNGARDQQGNIAQVPNLPPAVLGYAAYNSSFNRIDSIRVNNTSYLSFYAPANAIIYIPVLALDTADGALTTPPAQFTSFKIKCSLMKDDFSNATTINCTYNTPITYPVWQATVNTSAWTSGTTVYFRVYVNDGFQATDEEYPKNSFYDYYKTYFSFLIQ